MTPLFLTIQAFWSLKRSTTLPSSKVSGKPALNFDGGSDRTLGNMKRTVPSVMAAIAAENVAQPMTHQLRMPARKMRRSGPAAGLAGGFCGAGFGAAAAGTVFGATLPSGGWGGCAGGVLVTCGSDMEVRPLPWESTAGPDSPA